VAEKSAVCHDNHELLFLSPKRQCRSLNADEKTAGILTCGVESLDAVVAAVRDQYVIARIDGHVVRIPEVAVARARRSKLPDALAVVDAVDGDRVAEGVGDHQLTSSVDRDAVRPAELTFPDVRYRLTSQRHYLTQNTTTISCCLKR